ncbi:MAG: RNA-binding protein [Dysgonamonadaceae bacterium]|nr:RNA-binding protein [Dysgonamonadaceae bacterium]MDD4729563.1 RNA-binding protein [Dysgonamonadaceae bacterium]
MNIFIAGLTYRVTESDLIDIFEDYGTISSAKVITDRDTGQSRGFGFVKMADKADGQRAIEELNEAEFDGRIITVNVARPRTERANRN